MVYDLIVAGAGPGGLICAVEAAAGGLKVLVLEKNEQPGKKLLASGSGQCNLTHALPMESFVTHYHERGKYVRKTLNQFPPEALIRYFETLGVPLETLPNGKVFPSSRRASEVLNALLEQLERRGGQLRNREAVQQVTRTDGLFNVRTASAEYQGKCLLIAVGGCTYPSLGTSGDGYELARSLGHHIESLRPALAPVKVQDHVMSALAGVTLKDARISLWRKNKKLKEYAGDLLITHEGFSGPVILNNSRDFRAKDVLKLNLVRQANEESFVRGLTEHLKAYGKYTVRKTLDYYDVPRRVLELVLEVSGIPLEARSAEITKAQRNALSKGLFGFAAILAEVGPLEAAMVTAGGVATEEVNPATMESRLVPGLYFAGEVLDVDGVTGGFNLQFAFSSGVAAARSITKALELSI